MDVQRVLLIEDNPGDARLILEALAEVRDAPFDLEYADRLSVGLERLAHGRIDLILLDLVLPDRQGLDTFIAAHVHARDVPIVVLTGLDDVALAVAAIQAGAQDYLVKGQVDGNLLVRSMLYAIARKRFDEALHEGMATLERRVAEHTHELRTALTNVKLYLALLDQGRPDRRDQYMQTLYRETDRIEALIETFLAYTRNDRGATSLRLIPTDLNHIARDLIASQTALAAERGLSLDDQSDPHLPLALADPNLTCQVMTNLIANAIYYTSPGGSVTLTTTIRRREEATWVTFTVQDTGPGISAEEMSHLFERFFRGEAAQTTGTPGAGLGLAICKEIVDKMNGLITVDSQPGKGAAFTVWLRPAERET